MNGAHCPHCLANGVNCPLIIGGKCTHCGRPDAPFSRRLTTTLLQLRLTWDSITRRLRTARYSFSPRPIVGRFLACVWIIVFISWQSNRL